MRQLFPNLLRTGVEPLPLYAADSRPTPADRPWVLVNMVCSVDGATAVDGVSGTLGGRADRAAFTAIRAVADVILVAAGTARAEGYGPPSTPPAVQEQRAGREQTRKPRIALVTRRMDLDFGSDLFGDPESRCIVVVPEDAPPGRVAAANAVADVLPAGRGGVDLGSALSMMYGFGVRTVLCEGGPSLLGQLASDDLIDEVCLTLSPHLVGGDSARIAHGEALPGGVAPLRLARILEENGVLLFRYLRDRTL